MTPQSPSFLDHVFPGSAFSEEDRAVILPAFRRVCFSRYDSLLNAGAAADEYWFVESGAVRSFVINSAGKDITTNFYGVGGLVIDWVAFFTRCGALECIEALTDSVCWGLSFAKFQELFESVPSFRETGRSQLVQSYFALKRHSLSLIADEAAVRYRRFTAEHSDLAQSVPLKHLSSYLGVTDTSLSRVRRELARQGA
jgi:CRP-like cAMP-binding protein